MVKQQIINRLWIIITAMVVLSIIMSANSSAQPFGKGLFNENVPFGSQTSLSIGTSGNVSMSFTPSGSPTLTTANNTVTVTSNDVVGYRLYIMAYPSSNMASTTSTIPASSNVSPAALSTNTWGYNLDASSNFTGVTTSNVLIKSQTGPYTSGDPTVITYGTKLDNTQEAGSYTATVYYTAAPQTD